MAIPNRKVVITSFGPAATSLEIVNSTIAPPPKGHVQVKIYYAGFSGADINMRLGIYPLQKSAPLTPGYCFAGRVTANGPGAAMLFGYSIGEYLGEDLQVAQLKEQMCYTGL